VAEVAEVVGWEVKQEGGRRGVESGGRQRLELGEEKNR